MSRRRVLAKLTPPVIPPASDIVLFDNQENKEIVISGLQYDLANYPKDRFTPIGVVVIPKDHAKVLYPEGHACYNKPVMMSLKYMRYDTPDEGGAAQAIYWGDYNKDLSLQNYQKSAVVANSEADETSTESSNIYSYIPSTKLGSGTESKAAPKTRYNSSPYCPSPFLFKDGIWGPNSAYYNCPATCVQHDRDGKGNTAVILEAVSVEHWETNMGTPAIQEHQESVQTTEGFNIVWTTQSGTWYESALSGAYDGKKFTCKSPGANGTTVIRCTVSGKAGKVVFTCKSDGENYYDYLYIGKLDTECTTNSFKENMKGMQGQIKSYVFDIPDENEHYIEFCYNKDGSGDNGADNAEVYVTNQSVEVVVPAQAAVPPITNSYSAGNYPAACCCWRFHTVADNQGDWYLPAGGELGYIMPFFTQHNNAISRINQVYGESSFAVALESSYYHWSSSEYSSSAAYNVGTDDGRVDYYSKHLGRYVRAFRPVSA